MVISFKAKCHIFEPNYRMIRAQFDVDQLHELFPEYVVVNLLRERGTLEDGRSYRITIEPLPR